uniref:Odorant receptor n=1 Tax=Conogethes pinicolalis TaxID=1178461 RepID=A0A5B9GA53_9NEOP|nr:odorant receptor 6 [Conogethes pinicolalis]
MNGNEIKPDPMSLPYMRYTRLILISVGAWPGDAVAGRALRPRLYAYYLMLETAVLITGELLFILNQFHVLSFFVLGDVYIALSLSVLVMFRAVLSCFKRYGTIFRQFIRKFHLMHFKHKSEYSNQMYEKVNQISHYFTLFMIGLSVSGVVSFNITPLYHNYRLGVFRDQPPENVSAEFSVHYLFPGFRQEDFYLPSTLANVFISYICAFLICTMDLFLCLMIFQIIGHIKTLIHTLRNFPAPKKEKELQGFRQGNKAPIEVEIVKHFDDQENEVIKKIITECVEYHLFIVSFTEDISNFFGPMLAFNYLYHMFSFSLLLVECMQGQDALMRYGPLTMMTLAQLTQLSVTFEIVGSESEKLKDEVYYIPWESMNVSNQKSVGFFLKRVQTPIRVTAMGMTAVGVQTMGGILKTTFSYCAFLRSLNP